MTYTSSSNKLVIHDYKTGDTMYVNYAYTNTSCGTVGSACAPSSYGTIRRSTTGIGSETYYLTPGSYTYVLLQLCNDDAPPDTCSNWKRSAA